MYSELAQILAGIATLGMTIMMVTNTILSIRLRKERARITDDIVLNVPSHMQQRIRFGIDSNMSWVFGSLALYFWFAWLMFKFGWHVTPEQFRHWHQAIKRAYGKHIYMAYVSCGGANVGSIAFLLFFCVID